MFGLLIPGKPVLADPQTISPTQFAFSVPSTPPFNHIAVFLLPGTALPADAAAAVYLQLPNAPTFRLLGAVANDKPSAIFKLNNTGVATTVVDDAMTDVPPGQDSASVAPATIGIAIEPAAQVAAALAALRSSATPAPAAAAGALVPTTAQSVAVPTKILAQRIIRDAFNFLASFTRRDAGTGEELVPLKSFQDWWAKFEKKIELDPGFLERGEG